MSTQVGIVVPCKNEAASLERCLRSLRDQRGHDVTIVVVDNGSTDGSVDIARRLADQLIELPHASIAQLRNTGARWLGDVAVIGFVDADCEVASSWLASGLAGLEHADMVGSRTYADPEAGWVSNRWATIEQATAHDASLLWSQHLLVQGDAFRALGGFSEDLKTGEDADLSARLRTTGGSVALVPAMEVIHHGFPTTLKGFLRRELWHTSTGGWFSRMSPKSRALVVAASAWTATGAGALVAGVARGSGAPAGLWLGMTIAGLPALGYLGGHSVRHSLTDGVLVGIWSAVRVGRLAQQGVTRPMAQHETEAAR